MIHVLSAFKRISLLEVYFYLYVECTVVDMHYLIYFRF
jgi:hypothetical protein